MKNKYNVSYTPSSDNKGLITILWTPIKSWGEGDPTYTEEEAHSIVKFIREYPISIPVDMSDWSNYKLKLNKQIFELYGK